MISPKVAGRLEVDWVQWKRWKIDQKKKVRVAIPISKPIRRGGFVAGSDGEQSWVNFKYERLSIFCHYCGLLGHDLKHSASHYAASKKEGEVCCQYGEWLLATVLRSWSLPKRDSGRFTSTDLKGGG
ncbi:hypothetical protein CFP56_040402 [Quercus suber]|uniref:Zinc knuckle CX2CX4HX4C domain-containing protein n=1 Tax=Quercus suber TaxID=58331 RepID=A0AAW0IZ96_QUESU